MGEVTRMRECSERTVLNHVSKGLLPKPIRVTARTIRWPESELIEIHEALIAGATQDQVRALVKDLEARRGRVEAQA
jgi:prophage regulatory protein